MTLPEARKLEGIAARESVLKLEVTAKGMSIELPVMHILNSEHNRMALATKPSSETKVIQLLEAMQNSSIDSEIDLQSHLWPGTVPLSSSGSTKAAQDVLAACKEKYGKPYTMIGAGIWPKDGGVSVVVVYPRAAADRAGLRVGDVITAVDRQPVTETSSFAKIIRSHAPGERISLTVTRIEDGHRKTMPLDLELSASDAE